MKDVVISDEVRAQMIETSMYKFNKQRNCKPWWSVNKAADENPETVQVVGNSRLKNKSLLYDNACSNYLPISFQHTK